jgi:peptidoglycan-associated lipoprotein
VAAVSILGAGCHKKVAASAPPAPATRARVHCRRATARTGPEAHACPGLHGSRQTPHAGCRNPRRIDELLSRIQDAYFDYDRHILRPDAEALRADAKTLGLIVKDYPDYRLVVQGNCDERGSEEYNLALGDARANTSREYLASLGLPEECWQKNRRAPDHRGPGNRIMTSPQSP